MNGSSITSLNNGTKKLPELISIKMVKPILRVLLLIILFLNILEYILNKNLKDNTKIQLSVLMTDLEIVTLNNG